MSAAPVGSQRTTPATGTGGQHEASGLEESSRLKKHTIRHSSASKTRSSRSETEHIEPQKSSLVGHIRIQKGPQGCSSLWAQQDGHKSSLQSEISDCRIKTWLLQNKTREDQTESALTNRRSSSRDIWSWFLIHLQSLPPQTHAAGKCWNMRSI